MSLVVHACDDSLNCKRPLLIMYKQEHNIIEQFTRGNAGKIRHPWAAIVSERSEGTTV